MVELEIDRVSKVFGGTRAVDDITLRVTADETIALIGPNGSGKSTLFNVASGFLPPTSGKIRWQGDEIQGKRPEEVCRLGIARTFQEPTTFPRLTTRQCLYVATSATNRTGKLLPEVVELIGLAPVYDTVVSQLPLVTQRMLGVALAVCAEPSLLLLDEPAAGLDGSDAEHLAALLKFLESVGISIVIVEHDMGFVLPLAPRTVVLSAGAVIYDGPTAQVALDENVRTSYLGDAA